MNPRTTEGTLNAANPPRRQLSPQALQTRRGQLFEIGRERPLSPAERHELENLDRRFYMREWRRQLHQPATRKRSALA